MTKATRVTWNAWKLATIGIAVVVSTAVVTGLVVATWNGTDTPKPAATATSVPNTTQAPIRQAVPSGRANNPTTEVLEKALIGGVVGAGVGAAGGAIAGGGKGAGKGAAIGGIVGATAGTLYGLSEANKK